jgi:ribosomal protein S18 acetylase RimI-like enzyme
MKEGIMNKEVEYLKKENINSYISFIKDVFDYEATVECIEELIEKHKVLVILNQDKVIASVILEEHHDFIKDKKYYHVHYFGVLKEYRRMGYANRLFEKIEELVKENDIKYLELTSGNHRKAAHYFYQGNGFKIKDTTVFVKIY